MISERRVLAVLASQRSVTSAPDPPGDDVDELGERHLITWAD